MDTLYLYQMLTGLPARKAVRYNTFSTCDWSIFLNSVFLLVETDKSDSLLPGGDGLSGSRDEKIPRLKKVEQQFEKLANNEQNKTFIFLKFYQCHRDCLVVGLQYCCQLQELEQSSLTFCQEEPLLDTRNYIQDVSLQLKSFTKPDVCLCPLMI